MIPTARPRIHHFVSDRKLSLLPFNGSGIRALLAQERKTFRLVKVMRGNLSKTGHCSRRFRYVHREHETSPPATVPAAVPVALTIKAPPKIRVMGAVTAAAAIAALVAVRSRCDIGST